MSDLILSAADLSWVRLRRHDQECAECRLRMNEARQGAAAAQRLVFTVPPTPAHLLVCDERNRLLSVHEANMKAEKEPKTT